MWRIPVHQKLKTSSAFMLCATLGWVHILPRVVQAKVEEDCVVCTSILPLPSDDSKQNCCY